MIKKNEKTVLKEREEVFSRFYSVHFDAIKKHLPNIKNAKTIEVGCQTAYFSALFAKAGADCYCIDNEKKELEKGKRLFKELGLKAKFVLMDGFDLKFADNSFDVVFNHGVIEHFKREKQDKMLLEMKRVSKNLVYVSVPNKFHPESSRIKNESRQKKHTGNGFKWEHEFYPFTFRELKKLFERNGLEIIELFGSLHWFKKNSKLNSLLQKTIGLLLGFELCALGKKQ